MTQKVSLTSKTSSNSIPLTTTAFYDRNTMPVFPPHMEAESYYQIGKGMWGGPKGTYGKYLTGGQDNE